MTPLIQFKKVNVIVLVAFVLGCFGLAQAALSSEEECPTGEGFEQGTKINDFTWKMPIHLPPDRQRPEGGQCTGGEKVALSGALEIIFETANFLGRTVVLPGARGALGSTKEDWKVFFLSRSRFEKVRGESQIDHRTYKVTELRVELEPQLTIPRADGTGQGVMKFVITLEAQHHPAFGHSRFKVIYRKIAYLWDANLRVTCLSWSTDERDLFAKCP